MKVHKNGFFTLNIVKITHSKAANLSQNSVLDIKYQKFEPQKQTKVALLGKNNAEINTKKSKKALQQNCLIRENLEICCQKTAAGEGLNYPQPATKSNACDPVLQLLRDT